MFKTAMVAAWKEERVLSLFFSMAIAFIIIYVLSSNCPELFSLGGELMTVFYDISIAFLTVGIWYFFENFLPKLDKRKNAQKELNGIINVLTDLISRVIRNYYREEELFEIKFRSNPGGYIFHNINKVANRIAKELKLTDMMKFRWNKTNLTFFDEFLKANKEFEVRRSELLLKYDDCLEQVALDSIEKIHRNLLFGLISDPDLSGCVEKSQDCVDATVLKDLLENMNILQQVADRVNAMPKK